MQDFESFKKFISNRFAVIRNAHNISARKLSIEMGQSTEYINQIENGRKMPSMEGLFNFCDYFQIIIGEFFDSTQIYPVQYKEIVENLNKLDNEELTHISKNIEYIAELLPAEKADKNADLERIQEVVAAAHKTLGKE